MMNSTNRRRWSPNVIHFAMTTDQAIGKLKKSMERLGAELVDYDANASLRNPKAWVKIKYRGEAFEFEYSKLKADHYHKVVPDTKDYLVAVVKAIEDLTRIAERGIWDFGTLIQGFKALPHIELIPEATFMGLQTMPTDYYQVQQRYRELVKGPMNNEKHPDNFKRLNDVMTFWKQFFHVEDA